MPSCRYVIYKSIDEVSSELPSCTICGCLFTCSLVPPSSLMSHRTTVAPPQLPLFPSKRWFLPPPLRQNLLNSLRAPATTITLFSSSNSDVAHSPMSSCHTQLDDAAAPNSVHRPMRALRTLTGCQIPLATTDTQPLLLPHPPLTRDTIHLMRGGGTLLQRARWERPIPAVEISINCLNHVSCFFYATTPHCASPKTFFSSSLSGSQKGSLRF